MKEGLDESCGRRGGDIESEHGDIKIERKDIEVECGDIEIERGDIEIERGDIKSKCGDIESEDREDKQSCEATRTDLMRGNFDETSDFLESEHNMTLVREVAIVLGNFAFLGVEARRGKVEREKTSVWDLGKVVLGQIIKHDVSPMEARPRERACGRGHQRLSGQGRWRAVGRVQRRQRQGQEGVLRGDDGRGRGNVNTQRTLT